MFYYAKQGVTIGGRNAEHEDTTADTLVTALQTLNANGSDNTAEKGKVTLTAGTNKEVRNLANFENYYYTVRVQETANADNGANTAKTTTQTLSAAAAPHKVTSPTVDVSVIRKLAFKATAPTVFGTKKDGTAVAADEVKYWLYYAQVGVIENSVTVTTNTTAEHVVEAVDAVTGTDNKNIGKIELTGNTGTEIAFVLDGVTGGKQYRYTIIAVHPEYPDDNTLKSAYATGTATVKSEAIAPGMVTSVSSTPSGDTVTITATAPTILGTKKDGLSVAEKDIIYRLYYAQVGGADGVPLYADTTAIKSKAEVSDVDAATAGKMDLTGSDITTGFTVTGITKDTMYRYFIRAIHPVDENLYADTIDPLAFELSSSTTGAGGTVAMISATLNEKPRKTIASRAYQNRNFKHAIIPDTVDNIEAAAFAGNPNLKTVTLDRTLFDTIRKQRGRLSQVFGSQVKTYRDKDGYVFIAVPESVTRPSATEASGIVTITATAPRNRGTQDDTEVSTIAIKYELYYARVGYNGIIDSTTAADVVAAVGTVPTPDRKDAGTQKITGNKALTTGFTLNWLTGGEQYRYTIITVHPQDAFTSDPAPAKTVRIPSKATAPSAVTALSATEAGGIVTITATAPTAGNRGTKINGAAVAAKDIIYWLYYARVGYNGIISGDTSTKVVAAVGTAPSPDPKNAGKLVITDSNTLKTTGFTITGLTGGAQYRYTIVSIHPKDPTLTSAPTPAKTVRIPSKATAPASVTVTVPVITGDGTTVTITATAPSSLGTKINGDAVGVDGIKYELYYAKVGGTDSVSTYGDTDTTAIKGKAEASDVDAAIAGKVELTGNTALTRTGFEVTGISADFIYRYFIRSINPSEETKYSDTSDTLMFVLPSNGVVKIVSAEKPAGTPRTEIANEEYKWTSGKDKITHVAIPDTVTRIGANAFKDNKLMSVSIPNKVTSIGNYAFDNNKLTSITIGTGVTSIGEYAFQGNYRSAQGNQITSVSIPDSVTSIGKWAFYSNELTSLTIGTGVTEIGANAFYDNKLTNVSIPNKVTSIGNYAFQKNKLTSVTLGNSVQTIGEYAFYGKRPSDAYGNQLTNVVIPDSVTSIGNYAFQKNRFTTVTLGNSVQTIGTYAFYGNSNKSIGNYAFKGNQLTSVSIPEGIVTAAKIGTQAFHSNPNLTTVTLKKGELYIMLPKIIINNCK